MIHLYRNGPPALGREGVADYLTIKAQISNERLGHSVRVEAIVDQKNELLGLSIPSVVAPPHTFQLQTSDVLEGVPVRNIKVNLMIDGQKVGEITTPATFVNHAYVADFGRIRITQDCIICQSGQCIPGSTTAKLGP